MSSESNIDWQHTFSRINPTSHCWNINCIASSLHLYLRHWDHHHSGSSPFLLRNWRSLQHWKLDSFMHLNSPLENRKSFTTCQFTHLNHSLTTRTRNTYNAIFSIAILLLPQQRNFNQYRNEVLEKFLWKMRFQVSFGIFILGNFRFPFTPSPPPTYSSPEEFLLIIVLLHMRKLHLHYCRVVHHHQTLLFHTSRSSLENHLITICYLHQCERISYNTSIPLTSKHH